MEFLVRLRSVVAAAAIACIALPALAQDDDAPTTADDVRAEISEAIDAIANYSEQESEQAQAEAREALNQLDAEIERREQALRERWAEMSDAARETARSRLQDLREARNRLGERFGALQAGTSSAWDELKAGFADAWAAFLEAWNAADEEPAAN
jgi:DNA repair exonuclease SbcCD ATPase subunit